MQRSSRSGARRVRAATGSCSSAACATVWQAVQSDPGRCRFSPWGPFASTTATKGTRSAKPGTAHPQREDPTPRPRSRSSSTRFTVGTKRSLAGEGRAQRHLVERSGRAEAGPGREAPDGVRRGRGSRYTDVIAEESLPAGRGGVGQISRATEPALPAEDDAIVGRGHVAHCHPRADILASAIDDEDRAAVRGDPRREAVAGLTWHAHIHLAG